MKRENLGKQHSPSIGIGPHFYFSKYRHRAPSLPLQLLILNLTGVSTTEETHFWACGWRSFYIRLTELGLTINIRNTFRGLVFWMHQMEKASWESVSRLHACCLLVGDGYKGTRCLLHCAPELWTTTNSSFLKLLSSAPAKRKVKFRLSSGPRLCQIFLPAWDQAPMCLPPCSSLNPAPREKTYKTSRMKSIPYDSTHWMKANFSEN